MKDFFKKVHEHGNFPNGIIPKWHKNEPIPKWYKFQVMIVIQTFCLSF